MGIQKPDLIVTVCLTFSYFCFEKLQMLMVLCKVNDTKVLLLFRDLATNCEKQLNDQINVLNGDKEELHREIVELKNHLAALEEQKEHQKRELGEAHRNIKEG